MSLDQILDNNNNSPSSSSPPPPPITKTTLVSTVNGTTTTTTTTTTTINTNTTPSSSSFLTVNGTSINTSSSRKERLRRACTSRPVSERNYYSVSVSSTRTPKKGKVGFKKSGSRKGKERDEGSGGGVDDEEEEEEPLGVTLGLQRCSKVVTKLVMESDELAPSQLPRRELRSMWELASLLNFLHVFRSMLNITEEFTAEELETALITPNSTLDHVHIPLLKSIPPIARMALGRGTWVTVLCRKIRDWWHWVADGDIPIVASQGGEVDAYNVLDPRTRVLILKALCDIRVEQEDIRNYIDHSMKQGIQLSVFRKERVGGDSNGVSYWYEDDPIVGHRLYREIRKVEVNKLKTKGVPSYPVITRQWETVATNLDEFEDVSEKLLISKSRIENSLAKKLKIDMIPEVEKLHKKREKMIKKQHREAILLDNFMAADGLVPGRSLRDRKPVTYTFDDFDKSINDAIKVTKRKQPSPESTVRKEAVPTHEATTNGRSNGRLHTPQHVSDESPSPKSGDSEYNEEEEEEYESVPMDRGNRKRQKPRRYSGKEFIGDVSDFEADFDTDDEIVGEAVYDDAYVRSRKQKKLSSSSEGEEEYNWSDENIKDEEPEDLEEEEADSRSSSENSEQPHRSKKTMTRKAKLRSVDEIESGLRRSRRATRNCINYQQYELSDTESDEKPQKPSASEGGKSCQEYSSHSQDFHQIEDNQEKKVDQTDQHFNHAVDEKPILSPQKSSNSSDEVEGVGKRRFLDLNQLAPGTGFDDGLM